MGEMSIRDDIEKIVKELGITRENFFEQNKQLWNETLKNIVKRFVDIRHYTHNMDLHWAWESFKEPGKTLQFKNDDGYKYLIDLIDDNWVWFIVEDYKNKMWIYEGEIKTLLKIIPETTYLDEYYIVSKKYEWIICEDHHAIFHGSGTKIVERMKRFKEKYSEVVF